MSNAYDYMNVLYNVQAVMEGVRGLVADVESHIRSSVNISHANICFFIAQVLLFKFKNCVEPLGIKSLAQGLASDTSAAPSLELTTSW